MFSPCRKRREILLRIKLPADRHVHHECRHAFAASPVSELQQLAPLPLMHPAKKEEQEEAKFVCSKLIKKLIEERND